MKRIIFLLLTVISFAAYGQTDDTTKYINYRFQYGSRMPRYYADSVLRIPVIDTSVVGHKAGRILQRPADKLLYIDNGTKWNQIAGGAIGDTVLRRDSTFRGNGVDTAVGLNAPIAIPYIYNVADYGIKPDGIDHTTAFINLLTTAHTAGGGTIQFNRGRYKFSGKIKFPYSFTDPTLPEMNGIVIRGVSSGANGRIFVANNGGTQWDLTYVGSPAKIDTRGAGRLEISNIAFMNTNAATDSTAFIQTTNTSLYIHDCSFVGAGAGYTASITDCILLGGTSSVTDTSVNAGFQGYGTTIQTNFFDRVRRGVYGKIYANAVTVDNNVFWNASGGTVNNAAVEFRGDGSNSCAGSKITNNLFELVGYKYGIKLMHCVGFSVTNNQYYDRNGYNLYPVYAGTGTEYNEISETFVEGLTTSVYDSLAVATSLPSKNYIKSSLQGGKNSFPNNVDISGELYKRGSYGPRVYDNNGNSSYWVTIGGASNGALVHYLAYKPASAAEEVLVSYDRPATAGLNVIFGYQATSYVKFKSAVGHMYFNVPVGKELWFGEAGLEKHYITGGTLYGLTPIKYSGVTYGMLDGNSLITKAMADSSLSYSPGLGIDLSSKVITNTLFTGLGTSQGIFGGNTAGGSISIGSTNDATKGNINWGTTAQFREALGWLGIGKSPFSALDVTTTYSSGQTLTHLELPTGTGFGYGLYVDGARDSGVVATISNLATAATANAEMRIVVKDGTSGDAHLHWTNGVIDYSAGIDNSDADKWKLGPFANPSLVTAGITMDVSGNLLAINKASYSSARTLTALDFTYKQQLDTALLGIVPSQTGNSGKYLTTNGTVTSWGTVSAGSGVTKIKNYDPSFGFGLLHHVSSGLDSLYGRALEVSGPLNLTMPSAPADTVVTIVAIALDSTHDGYMVKADWNRLFGRQKLANPTGTITFDPTLGGQAGITFTSTGGRTLAFSNLRYGGSIKLHIENTSGATITLTLPSNSRLTGTGSVSTITIPTGNSTVSLNDYDGTNYLFGLSTD